MLNQTDLVKYLLIFVTSLYYVSSNVWFLNCTNVNFLKHRIFRNFSTLGLQELNASIMTQKVVATCSAILKDSEIIQIHYLCPVIICIKSKFLYAHHFKF